MTKISIRFELKEALSDLTPQTREVLGAVVARTAFAIERRAKMRVPVDTGNLKNSIRANVKEARAALRAEVGAGGSSDTGTAVEYAAYVEFGTSRKGARPYFTPAVEEERPFFEKAVGLAIEQGAKAAASRKGIR